MQPHAQDTSGSRGEYIPALRFRFLTRLYDPVVALSTRERRFKAALLAQTAPAAGERILDVGCGTGTLAIQLKATCSKAEIIGLDGDEQILQKARSKTTAAGMEIAYRHALADEMPFDAGTLDKVVSSLFFHHLSREKKLAVLREVLRLLKPGGMLHIADWGKAANPLMRAAFFVVQLLDGFATTTDNVEGCLPDLLQQSGFTDVQLRSTINTPLGTIALLSGRVG